MRLVDNFDLIWTLYHAVLFVLLMPCLCLACVCAVRVHGSRARVHACACYFVCMRVLFYMRARAFLWACW